MISVASRANESIIGFGKRPVVVHAALKTDATGAARNVVKVARPGCRDRFFTSPCSKPAKTMSQAFLAWPIARASRRASIT
jgi:hypothetical protein